MVDQAIDLSQIGFDSDEKASQDESETEKGEGVVDNEQDTIQAGKIESLEVVEDIIYDEEYDPNGGGAVVVLSDENGQTPPAPPDSTYQIEKDTSKNGAKNTEHPIEGALPPAVQKMVQHPPGTEVDHKNKKVLRDERGRILAGSGAINAHGSLNPLQVYLKKRYGDASEEIIKELDKIAFYDQIKSRHKWALFKSSDKLKALEMLLDRSEGKPKQTIDATVEQRTLQVNIDVPDDAEIVDIN